MKRPHLISVDELRAAGALDVPPAWRKSLGGEKKKQKERNLLLFGDDDTTLEVEQATRCDADSDSNADSATNTDEVAEELP